MLESLFNKVAGLTLLKRDCQYRCFLLNIAKSLKTPFSQNILGGYF